MPPCFSSFGVFFCLLLPSPCSHFSAFLEIWQAPEGGITSIHLNLNHSNVGFFLKGLFAPSRPNFEEGAGGSGGKTPPAPRTSVCRVNARSQPAQRVHVIPPGKGMLGTRPSHVPPSPTPAFCLGPGAEVHGSPKLLFFEKTCRGLPVSVAVETPDDVT